MRARIVLRLFLVQALWNHRTMQGPGLAWALVPALRRRADGNREHLEAALRRQSTHFNAHPYLAGVAAGALARLEADEAPEEMVRRFREILRGPLGSLGDALIWNAWLPTCLLGAAAAGMAGVPPLLAVLGFLLVYNALHLGLRWWGAGIGLALGAQVGEALRSHALPRRAERVGRAGVLLLGLLAGLVLGGALLPEAMGPLDGSASRDGEAVPLPPAMAGTVLAVGAGLFVLGFVRGRGSWWWTAILLPGTIALVALAGVAA